MHNLNILKKCYLHIIDEKRNWVSKKMDNFPIGRAGIQARPVYSKPLKYPISVFLGFTIQAQGEKDEF